MISTRTVDQVRDVNIYDVVSRYVTLKKAGANYTACCPFHNEKSPSFSVSPVKNFYHCFGCGVGGDGINFVMAKDGVEFNDAVEKIAGYAGILVEYEKDPTPEAKEARSKKETLYKVAEWAAVQFQNALTLHPEGKTFWLGRGFTEETISRWRLGYAPAGYRYICDKLADSGKMHLAKDIDLVKITESRSYDTYVERAIIPIQDRAGRVIAFGGRVIAKDSKYSKYINSGETPLYSKSKELFGLSLAGPEIRKQNIAVLTEGYTDVIRLHQVGIDVAVASCGTALTKEQAHTLRRYTDNVVIMRDGDKPGLAAAEKDLIILLQEKFNVYITVLPSGEDPDSFFATEKIGWLTNHIQDAILWHAMRIASRVVDISSRAEAISEVAELLDLIAQPIRRSDYIKHIAFMFNLKPSELEKLHTKHQSEKQRVKQLEQSEQGRLPRWMKAANVLEIGFDQLDHEESGYGVGVYFSDDNSVVHRVTNFTIQPLYHIKDPANGRRVVKISNGKRSSVIELNNRAITSLDAFDMVVVDKGPYSITESFTKFHFKRLASWIMNNVNDAYEMQTLGWQPEGFFAFADKVYHGTQLLDYNNFGAVDINGISYMSLGMSALQSDFRQEDNPYENDLYLKFKQSPITFQQWSKLFYEVYPTNGMYGILFVFITLFKDVIRNAGVKIPHLYCYGTKGSGKSDFSESITWLFFSGKNPEGDMMHAFNLNPGQSTPFSFSNRMARFRNCPVPFNEFDEQNIEEYKFGAFKAAYDGEGREVGDGSTGRKKKTKIDKVQGTCIIVGQYLTGKDDGSLLSRSIPCQFVESFVKMLSEEAKSRHTQLKAYEQEGLSSLIIELMEHRPAVAKRFSEVFHAEYKKLQNDCRRNGHSPEARILRNFSLCNAVAKIFFEKLSLPFTYDEVYNRTYHDVISHNRMLKDTSLLTNFWNLIEYLYDQEKLKYGQYFKIEYRHQLRVYVDQVEVVKSFEENEPIIFVRFDSLYNAFAGEYRMRSGKAPMDVRTLIAYLQDQPYYVGLVKVQDFDDKRTSCYALRYRDLGVVLERNTMQLGEPERRPYPGVPQTQGDQQTPVNPGDELPFN